MRGRFYRLTGDSAATGYPLRKLRESADLAVAVLPSGRQLVFRRSNRFATICAFTREIGDSAGQLAHRPGDGDAEHALPTLQQVDDLFCRSALIHGGAVGEERDVG